MLYRRFGRTDLSMPVFTCGGMRFQQAWKEDAEIEPENQRNLEATVERAFELGINHFETARGYGTSEVQLGKILPKLPRDQIIVQTKVGPRAEVAGFRKLFDKSLDNLNLEYVDLLALHGLNTPERLEWSVRPGGCLEVALELKARGLVRQVGFSAHWNLPVIREAVADGRFDYVNLHWYYVNPFHLPAIEAARQQDMGVLIISPNDKGGKLYEPSEKLCALTAPFSPMVFNDLWCLSRPEVHTLSVGAVRPADFDEHLKALPYLESGEDLRELLRPVEERLRVEMEKVLGREWVKTWHVGLPSWEEVPGQVNIFEILRLYNFAKALDMTAYGKMRYNLLGKGDCWFPGNKADKVRELDLTECLKDSPLKNVVPDILAEAHELLEGEPVKRLGGQH